MLEPRTPTVDMSTQTDDLPPPPTIKKTPPTLPPRTSVARTPTPPIAEVPETTIEQPTPPRAKSPEKQSEEVTPTATEPNSDKALDTKPSGSPRNSVSRDEVDPDDDDDDDEDDFEEEPVVHEIHQAAAPQAIRARVVQVAKPVAPALPVRNPFRNRVSTNSDGSLSTAQDTSAVPSPTVAKHSPDSTPSLMRGDSTSSLSSVEDNRLEQIGNRLKPKYSHEPSPDNEKDEKNDAFHSLPESPMKSIPGGFN